MIIKVLLVLCIGVFSISSVLSLPLTNNKRQQQQQHRKPSSSSLLHPTSLTHNRYSLSLKPETVPSDSESDLNNAPVSDTAEIPRPRFARRIENNNLNSNNQPTSTDSSSSSSNSNTKKGYTIRSIAELDASLDKSTNSIGTSSTTSKIFGGIDFEDLYARSGGKSLKNVKVKQPVKEDLNGIEPWKPLLSSIFPLGASVGGYYLTEYLAEHFAVQFLTSDLYPVQRLSMVARNVIVGLSALASAFCGVIGLGLLILGIAVSIGVIKGELNPNQPDTDSSGNDANNNSDKSSRDSDKKLF